MLIIFILFLLVSCLFWMISRKWGCHSCAYCIQMQIIICAQTLGSFLILFRALYFQSYHNIYLPFGIFFLPIGSLDILIACFIHWCSFTLLSFCNLLILNIVWFPSSIRHWIRAFDSTHIMRNAHIMEELSLYWPSRFLPILAMDANGVEVSRV